MNLPGEHYEAVESIPGLTEVSPFPEHTHGDHFDYLKWKCPIGEAIKSH